MSALNGSRQAVVGFPGQTAWLIHNRAETGDAVLCFDEYVPYVSQWFETYGYVSIDDRGGELERVTDAVEPLLDHTGLWVMCSPAGEAGMAQGRWLDVRGFRLPGGGEKHPRRGHSSSDKVESYGEEDAVFFMDLVSGFGSGSGDVGTLFDEMALYRGVSEEDVRTRSVRFMGYVSAMETLGRWKP